MATVNPNRKPVTYEGMAVALTRPVVALTGDLYVRPSDHGQIFSNRGTTAQVELFLPPVADVYNGWFIEVYSVDNDGIKVTAPADTMVAYNDATATSVTISTTGTNISAYVKVLFDGTSYIALVVAGSSLATATAGASSVAVA